MRDRIRVSNGGSLEEVDPVDFLWQFQWDRMGCSPGLPGWELTKFLCDNVSWHRNRLLILLDIEPFGKGIRFELTESKGRFWSSRSFSRRNGFSFEFSHSDYTLDALSEWFLQTADGDWDAVFAKATAGVAA